MSSIPLFESCKKRKKMPKLFALHSFADAGCPINPSGAFRDNIRVFLRDCAELEDYNIGGMPTWCTLLVSESKNFVVPLYTIEEDVKKSLNPYCDHCRCSGWSHHYLSKRKYHMIIPADEDWNKPLQDGIFDLQTHLLYGLFHCNGFGHLLCINGIEGGSRFLCGREIMDLWDRICENLQARRITVEDVSKKHSMELRLLHGVAYGKPWFGRWDYKFCHGNFGVSQHNYSTAVEILQSLKLNKVIHDFMNTKKYQDIKEIICFYRDLSSTELTTMSELLSFMLTAKAQALCKQRRQIITPPAISSLRQLARTATTPQKKHYPRDKSVKCRKFSAVIANMDSRWPARRLEFAAEVIVDALRETKANRDAGMTRQEVRDAARMHIGDTGLLDYVLKSMNNVIVGSYIVRRAVNPSTRVLEYTIRDLQNGASVTELPVPEAALDGLILASNRVPGADVYSDLAFLYKNILLEYPEGRAVTLATCMVLDSKHFVKEWPFRDEVDDLLRFICRVMPGLSILKNEMAKELSPCELIIVPPYATLGDLKREIETAFRDTYCIMEHFAVTDIEGIEGVDDKEVLFGMLESASDVWAKGYGIALENDLRYEGGAENWTVRCECGARDDDGERMVACDICEVWQHTRCIGIGDADAVPPLFVCARCCASLVPQKPQLSFGFEIPDSYPFHTVEDFGAELLY